MKFSFSFFIYIFVFWGSFFQSCDFEMIVKTKQQVCTAINSLFVQLTLRADPPMSLVLSMIGNFSTSKAVCVEQKLIFFYPISRFCLFMREIIFLQVAQLNLTLSNVRRSLSSGWQDASQRMIEELQNSLNRQREIVSHYCIVDNA